MLVIRKEQILAFEESAVEAFEDRTYAHLLEYFPRHCEMLGEAQMRQVIQHGWRKAKSYGLLAECCVRSYIELMCVLGSEFDTDPLLPWAAEILQDGSIADEVVKGDRLYHKAWNYVRRTARDHRDTKGQRTLAPLLGELEHVRLVKDDPLSITEWPAFASSLEARLYALLPVKLAWAGADSVKQAITLGAEQARQYGIDGRRGIALMVILRFTLGGGFDKDPLLPWAAEILTNETLSDQGERTHRLWMAGTAFLKNWFGPAFGSEG